MAATDTLPVDTSVQLPPAVRRAAEMAEHAHRAIYGGVEPPKMAAAPAAPGDLVNIPDAPDHRGPVTLPARTPSADAAPPVTAAVTAPPADTQPRTVEEYNHMLASMNGRVAQKDAIIQQLQQQMGELGDELIKTQGTIQQMQQPRQRPQPRTQPVRLVTQQDVDNYSPELIDLISRVAKQTVAPDISDVAREVQSTKHDVQKTAQQGVYGELNAKVPNWREININPRFKAWCALPDGYSGRVRGVMLKEAFAAADANRVVNFFNGFLQEEIATGQMPGPQAEPVTPRTAALPIQTIVAPGRGIHPNPGGTSADTTGVREWTRADIQTFYANVRRGAYLGREKEKQALEAQLWAAQNSGRVR